MARGNDAEEMKAAEREFLTRYGLEPNAEDLIQAVQASVDPAVVAAGLKPRDEEATEALDLDEVEEKAGFPVLSAAVRGTKREGQALVVVAEDSTGRTFKDVFPLDDRWKGPPETAAQAAYRKEMRERLRQAHEAEQAMEGIEEKVAEARAEAQAEAAEEIAKIKEEHAAEIEAIRAEAAEQAEYDPAAKPSGGSAYGSTGVSTGKPVLDPSTLGESGGSGGSSKSGGSGGGDFPRTHDELDALADENDVEWPEDVTKVDDKIAHLKSEGVKPE